jgi:hypothetical protein
MGDGDAPPSTCRGVVFNNVSIIKRCTLAASCGTFCNLPKHLLFEWLAAREATCPCLSLPFSRRGKRGCVEFSGRSKDGTHRPDYSRATQGSVPLCAGPAQLLSRGFLTSVPAATGRRRPWPFSLLHLHHKTCVQYTCSSSTRHVFPEDPARVRPPVDVNGTVVGGREAGDSHTTVNTQMEGWRPTGIRARLATPSLGNCRSRPDTPDHPTGQLLAAAAYAPWLAWCSPSSMNSAGTASCLETHGAQAISPSPSCTAPSLPCAIWLQTSVLESKS